MQVVYRLIVVYLAGLVIGHLLRGRRWGEQLTAALVLIPLLLRALWVK